MLSKITYLQPMKDKSDDREAYQLRIAEIQRASSSTALEIESPVPPRMTASPSRRDQGGKTGSAVRTFLRWFMRFILLVLFIILVSLILFIWSPSSHPGSVAAVVAENEPRMTAKRAHQVAETVALNWAKDARLISLSATWDAGQNFESGEGNWSLLYYSQAKSSTASISVFDGRAKLISAHGISHVIDDPQSSEWHIDSETAIDLLESVGGDEFLRAQPDATVTMSLDFSQEGAWRVRFIDQMSRRVFSAQVSIDDGQVTRIQQSG